ncbi:MAG: hypothetical protein MJE77_33065 [Proteobacteria bacterium]|nr:hypothetical protein [Pseudomonadota bacterium]
MSTAASMVSGATPSPVAGSVFGAVAASLQAVKVATEGESGAKISELGDARGVLPDLVRNVLSAMAEVLVWLHQTSVAAESQVIGADAMLASLEVLSEAIEAAGEGLSFGDLPETWGLPKKPFEVVGNGLQQGSELLDKGLSIGKLLPRPEELKAIQSAVEGLLGQHIKPDAEPPGPGALGNVMADIGVDVPA